MSPQPPPPLTHPAQPAQLHHPDLLGFRRRQVDRGGELRALPRPRRHHRGRDRRDHRAARRGPASRRLPAIAGTSGARSTSAGPICATTTSSIAPATCWKAPSPISWRPATAACSTSWRSMSTTSPPSSVPAPTRSTAIPAIRRLELALVRLYHLTKDRKRLDLAAYFINERGRQPHYFERRGQGARRRARRLLGRGPSNTTSRTSRCASRTRPSAMRCGRCTCTPPWRTLPPISATTR